MLTPRVHSQFLHHNALGRESGDDRGVGNVVHASDTKATIGTVTRCIHLKEKEWTRGRPFVNNAQLD